MSVKVFSVEQLRLNGELLSGDSLDRLWYAGNQLSMGDSAVPTGFNVAAGQGLSGGGTLDGSSISIDVNIDAASAGGLTIDTDKLKVDSIVNSMVADNAAIGVTKLAASGVTVTAGDGIAMTHGGVINLGQSQVASVDLHATDPGLDIDGGKLRAQGIKDSNVAELAAIHPTKLLASGVTVTAGNGLATTKAFIGLGESQSLSVDAADSTIDVASAGIKVNNVPNALTAGEGLSAGGTFNGGTAREFKVDSSAVVMLTGNQTINGLKDFAGGIHVHGDLTVDGTTTTVDSTVVNIGDNIIVLNNDATDAASSTDGGILIKRFSVGTTQQNSSLLWDNSEDEWRIGKEGAEESAARGKAFTVSLGLADDEETISIASANFQSTPVVHATVKNTTDTNPDLISCMVTAVSSTSVTVVLSAKPSSGNYVLELVCMAT